MRGTIVQIAKKELVTARRNRVILLQAGTILLLLLAAAWGGYNNYQTDRHIREQAQKEKRDQWLHQHPKHPHLAAHFGTFVYKPKTWLSAMDAGLDNYTGAYAYLEPHKQNDFVFKPAEGHNGSIRFGQLSVAMVLQLLTPLLIIFMGFSAITQERDHGTLKLLLSTGLRLPAIVAGKVLGQFLVLLIILLPALVCTSLFFAMQVRTAPSDWAIRSLMLAAAYGIYLLIWTTITVFVSAISRTAGNALLVLLCAWIVGCIGLPKAAANIASNRHPLPSQYAFREAIQKDIAHGIDGHNTKDERAKQLEQQLLRQYHVSHVSELPFNFEGYVMQAGEEYSSKVYDKYFHELQQTLIKQERYSRLTGMIDPYLAVQSLSMGLAGTDIYSHIHFQQQTESYRRKFVQQMNEDMKNNSKMGDWNYKSSTTLYAAIPDFTYTPLPASSILALYKTELVSMMVWLVLVVLLFRIILQLRSPI